MDDDSILSQAKRGNRPEPNIGGEFQCQQCHAYVSDAHYDGTKKVLSWWCNDDHKSVIEEFSI